MLASKNRGRRWKSGSSRASMNPGRCSKSASVGASESSRLSSSPNSASGPHPKIFAISNICRSESRGGKPTYRDVDSTPPDVIASTIAAPNVNAPKTTCATVVHIVSGTTADRPPPRARNKPLLRESALL